MKAQLAPLLHRQSSGAATTFAVLAVLTLLMLVASGLAVSTAALALLAVAVQGITGAVWWGALRGEDSSSPELFGAGIALGTLGAVLGAQVLRPTPLRAVGWLLPSACALAALAIPSFRSRFRVAIGGHTTMSAKEVALGVLALATGILPIVTLWLQHPLSWTGLRNYNGDIEFHEALAASVSLLGPDENILNLGGSVRYHWLAHGWTGAMTEWSAAEPFEVLTRVVPLVTLLGAGTLAWAWARSISDHLVAGPLAVVALVGAGEVGRLGTAGDHLSTLSPSQGLTTSWLLLAGLSVGLTLRARISPPLSALMLAILAFGLMGGKVNHAAVLGGGVAASIVLHGSPPRLSPRARGLIAGAALVGATAGYLTFISGGDGGDFRLALFSGVSISDSAGLPTALGLALGLASIAASLVVRWGPAMGVLGQSPLPETRFAIGAASAGVLVSLVTTQAGGSQGFFTLSASAVLATFVGVGLASSISAASDDSGRQVLRATLAGFIAAGAILAVLAIAATEVLGSFKNAGTNLAWIAPILFCLLAIACWTQWTALRRTPALIAIAFFGASIASLQGAHAYGAVIAVAASDASVERGWSMEHLTAGDWLRRTASVDDVVATNRLCKWTRETPPDCNTKSFLVAATTRHQVLIEGAQYSASVDGQVSQIARDRMALSTRFAESPNPDDLAELWDLGVRWFWLDRSVGGVADWGEFGTVEFENGAAVIIQLADPRTG